MNDPDDLEAALDALQLSPAAKKALKLIKAEVEGAWQDTATDLKGVRDICDEAQIDKELSLIERVALLREDHRRAVEENALLFDIATEVLNLRNSGYDGPFMGEAIEPLMRAFHKWERSYGPTPTEETKVPVSPNEGRAILEAFQNLYDELPEHTRSELDEWERRDELKALGEGPCPGDDAECHALRCTEHDHEDPSAPSQYPFPQWDGRHDFDGGQCWRCGGTAPGWGMREPMTTIPVPLLKRLVEWKAAVDRMAVRG